ncbi:hypothetical protein BH23PLA1_BH23PLA1_10090 [soil metagenome]
MGLLVPITLFGWIPVVLFLFAVLPPRRAVIVAFVAGWLLLPNAGYTFQGLPDYNKVLATTLGVLLGTVLFDSGRFFAFRPRWADLPMLIWCLCPIASSLSNDLGLYDGLSASHRHLTTWGLPYLIGRLYLGEADGLRELATAILIGGLLYVPPCLYEIRMSPQLHRMLYGFAIWGGTRYGGYRPQVFLSNGLELGMWMTAACLMGYALWAGGTIKRLWGLPFGALLLGLLLVTVLCKSTGALLLLAVGLAVLWVVRRTGSSLPVWVLILVSPLYMAVRTPGLWSGETLVELTQTYINEERAQSLEFRLINEDMLAVKALQRPVFGWSGWGRNRVYDEHGRDISITDGLWIIALGVNGLVGLGALTMTFLLPPALLLRFPVRSWSTSGLAPAAALAVLLGLYLIDNLSNAMVNPIYMLAAGGLVGLACPGSGWSGIGPLLELGRDLKEQGRPLEAAETWRRALEGGAGPPVDEADRGALADARNDLAWLLAADPGSAAHDPTEAVRWAREAVAEDPARGAYWNTLGAALYRAGDPRAAIEALRRSVELSGGGPFDDLLLALAHGRVGEAAAAVGHLKRARERLSQHALAHADLDRLRSEAEAEAVTLRDRDRNPSP